MDSYFREQRNKQAIREIKKVFLNKKFLKTLAATSLTIIGVGGVSAIFSKLEEQKENDHAISKSMVEILEDVEEETCIDEVFEEKNIDAFYVDQLQEYIKVSEQLNALNFAGYDYSKLSGSKLKSPKELRIMIAAYKDSGNILSDDDKVDLQAELKVQECLVNGYITNSYRYMENVTLNTFKAKVADSYNLDESYIKDITVSGYKDASFATMQKHEDGKDETVYLNTSDVSLKKLVNSVYSMQNKGLMVRDSDYNVKDSNPNEYNRFRNKYITDAVNNVKIVMNKSYKGYSDGNIQTDGFIDYEQSNGKSR